MQGGVECQVLASGSSGASRGSQSGRGSLTGPGKWNLEAQLKPFRGLGEMGAEINDRDYSLSKKYGYIEAALSLMYSTSKFNHS